MNHDRPGLPSLFHGLTPSLLRLLANADVHEDNRSAGSNHATPRPCTPRQVSRRWRWWRSSPIARPSRATSSAARLSRMRRTVSARRSRTSTKPRASPVCRYRSVEDVDLPYATYGAVRLGRPARISSGPLPPGCRPRSRLRRRCVLEQTPVTAVESGGPCQVRTAGGTVTAQTGRRGHPLPAARPWPLLRPPRAEPLVLHRGALPGHAAAGESISAGGTTRSVRSYGDLLILGGEGHTTGARQAGPVATSASSYSRASTGRSTRSRTAGRLRTRRGGTSCRSSVVTTRVRRGCSWPRASTSGALRRGRSPPGSSAI